MPLPSSYKHKAHQHKRKSQHYKKNIKDIQIIISKAIIMKQKRINKLSVLNVGKKAI